MTGLIVAPGLSGVSLGLSRPVETPRNTAAPLPSPQGVLHRFTAVNRALPPSSRTETKRFAFHRGSATAGASLKRNADNLDGIFVELLEFENRAGKLSIAIQPTARRQARWLAKNAAHLEMYALVDTHLAPGRIAAALASPQTRRALVARISEALETLDADGVLLDLQNNPETGHAMSVAFLRELQAELDRSGRDIAVVMPLGAPPHRYREIARYVRYVVLQLFSEDALGRQPTPIAAQDWFESELTAHAAHIPREKLVVGIGSFATEWDAAVGNRKLSVQAAWEVARDQRATPKLDPLSLNTGFDYTKPDATRARVWALDAVTAFNQTRAALRLKPAGLALTELGTEDPGVWASFGSGRLPGKDTLPKLETMEAGYVPFERHDFPLIAATQGMEGRRRLMLHEGFGLITDAHVETTPVQMNISGLAPAGRRKIALTFDDGPDPVFTPKILDVLKEKGVQATFYLIGSQVVRYPDIVQRIYAEGHDIGNHSYTHRDMFIMSDYEVGLELNAVQRLFEAELGIRTVLFRPPYAMRNYGELASAPQLLEYISDLGYLAGGIDVESFDYVLGRTAEDIRVKVTQDVLQNDGSVAVLMHDSGGKRDATVNALGPLIDELSARGYAFVSTHELVGRSRDSFMQPYRPAGMVEATNTQIRGGYIAAVTGFSDLILKVGVIAAILGIARLLLIMVAARMQIRREQARDRVAWRPDRISVLVPGYNEEKVICSTVSSILNSTVADRMEIIVMDDGSTDGTYEIVKKTFADEPRVKVFTKPNGGKSSALNEAITKASADIVVAIDADTIMLPDAIELLTRHFHDPALGAVAGNAVVGNRMNLITRMQALEYVTSQNLDRRALEVFNAISVVPGAIGAWRRSALIEAKGYGRDTLAEDADLTIDLERLGWKVIYESRAQALTEAPQTLRAFLKQRFRWMFGTLQVAYKNLGRVGTLPRAITWITIPNVLIFQFAFTLLAPFMDAILLMSIGTAVMSLLREGDTAELQAFGPIAMYWVLFQTVDLVVAAYAMYLDGDRRSMRLLPLVLVQRFTYRQLLYWTAIRVLLTALRGQLVGWGKLLRTGTVALAENGAQPVPKSATE